MNKDSKTIWYCHHYAGSPQCGMSYRPYYLSQEFSKAGHNIFIIRASFHHLLQKKSIQQQAIQLENIDGLPYINLKTPTYKGNGARRLLNMLIYAWRFKQDYKELIKITGKPDTIIVSSAHLFHFPTLEKISREIDAKLIFEVRDLWPLSLQKMLKGFYRLNPIILWLSYIEKLAYRKSDYVVSLLKDAFPHMSKKGLTIERFKVISNGVNLTESKNFNPLSPCLLSIIENLKKKSTFLLGYAGAMGKPNALEYLVKAMAILEKNNLPIHCILVGEGNLKSTLEAQTSQLKLTNITFYSAIPKSEIPCFLEQVDALYLGWNDTDLYKYGVSPNKLFDYLASGKPIIESAATNQSFVQKRKCGVHCKAVDPDAISKAIYSVYLMPISMRKNLGKVAKEQAKLFDYKLLANKYLELL